MDTREFNRRWSRRLVLLYRSHVERRDDLGDLAGDEAGGDRRAIEVQDGDQACGVDARFVHEQRLQLRIAVLLDDEYLRVRGDEVGDLLLERECANAKGVH